MDEHSKITTTSKMTAIKSFIETWLKDPRYYCNHCGEEFIWEFHTVESCCENPQFGKNVDHCKGLIEQNKRARSDQLKDTGADKKNIWRSCLSIPPRLYSDLETFFRQYEEKLFNDNREMRAFMKAFPQFCSCNKV